MSEDRLSVCVERLSIASKVGTFSQGKKSLRAVIEEKKSLGKGSLEILVCGFKDLLVFCKPEVNVNSTSFQFSAYFLGQVAKKS